MASLSFALFQIPLVWQDPKANRALLEEKWADFWSSQSELIDVVVFPETFTTGFTMTPQLIDPLESQRTLDWMLEKASKYQVAVCGSSVFYENEHYYNRFIFAKPDGSYEYYNKHHTFTLAGESKEYQAGQEQVLISYKGFKMRPLICYDLRFPVWSRNSQDYDVLLYVANWPKPRINAWDTLLQARAIENVAFSIGVNRLGTDPNDLEYPGHSAAYDPLGKTLCFSEKEEIIIVTLHRELLEETRKKLPFLEDRDSFNFL